MVLMAPAVMIAILLRSISTNAPPAPPHSSAASALPTRTPIPSLPSPSSASSMKLKRNNNHGQHDTDSIQNSGESFLRCGLIFCHKCKLDRKIPEFSSLCRNHLSQCQEGQLTTTKRRPQRFWLPSTLAVLGSDEADQPPTKKSKRASVCRPPEGSTNKAKRKLEAESEGCHALRGMNEEDD